MTIVLTDFVDSLNLTFIVAPIVRVAGSRDYLDQVAQLPEGP